MFDEFLKDNDRNAVEAIKVLVVDTKLYVDEYLANVLNDSRRTVLSLVFLNVFAAVDFFRWLTQCAKYYNSKFLFRTLPNIYDGSFFKSNVQKLWTIFLESSTVEVWRSPKYVCASFHFGKILTWQLQQVVDVKIEFTWATCTSVAM